MAIVLVVDDEVVIADVLSAVLGDEGHVALSAIHGNHALELLEQYPATHLVISDLFMPHLDGAGLLHTMKEHEHYRTIPFILMSTMPESHCKKLVAGHTVFRPSAFIQKPFDLDELIGLVASTLQSTPRTLLN